MTLVYFLRQKSSMFNVFKKFKSLVKTQSYWKIKNLILKHGKEYTSTEFELFCEDEGLHHQFTARYCLEQNDVCKRKNRRIMEMGRSMLAEKNVPKRF